MHVAHSYSNSARGNPNTEFSLIFVTCIHDFDGKLTRRRARSFLYSPRKNMVPTKSACSNGKKKDKRKTAEKVREAMTHEPRMFFK